MAQYPARNVRYPQQNKFQRTMQPQRKHTHWVLYVLTILVSLGVVGFIIGLHVLTISFLEGIGFKVLYYILISLFSFGLGLLTFYILYKLSHDEKLVILGGAIIPFIVAALAAAALSVMNQLAEQFALISGLIPADELGLLGSVSLFNVPSIILTVVLIVVPFNLYILIKWFQSEEKPISDVEMYLIGVLLFILIFIILRGLNIIDLI